MWLEQPTYIFYYNTGASVCLSVCPDDYMRIRSAWRFRFDTGSAWSGGQVEFASLSCPWPSREDPESAASQMP